MKNGLEFDHFAENGEFDHFSLFHEVIKHAIKLGPHKGPSWETIRNQNKGACVKNLVLRGGN